jgi:hypothetical protein
MEENPTFWHLPPSENGINNTGPVHEWFVLPERKLVRSGDALLTSGCHLTRYDIDYLCRAVCQ